MQQSSHQQNQNRLNLNDIITGDKNPEEIFDLLELLG
jgi:hypothetical protein